MKKNFFVALFLAVFGQKALAQDENIYSYANFYTRKSYACDYREHRRENMKNHLKREAFEKVFGQKFSDQDRDICVNLHIRKAYHDNRMKDITEDNCPLKDDVYTWDCPALKKEEIEKRTKRLKEIEEEFEKNNCPLEEKRFDFLKKNCPATNTDLFMEYNDEYNKKLDACLRSAHEQGFSPSPLWALGLIGFMALTYFLEKKIYHRYIENNERQNEENRGNNPLPVNIPNNPLPVNIPNNPLPVFQANHQVRVPRTRANSLELFGNLHLQL